MSQTHSIVCHSTKERLWIGQGTGPISILYSGEPKTMEALKWFLQKNRTHNLNIICDDTDEACTDYAEWSGVHNHGWRILVEGHPIEGIFKGTLPEAVKAALRDDTLRFWQPVWSYEEVIGRRF